jgi:hypothetical protein
MSHRLACAFAFSLFVAACSTSTASAAPPARGATVKGLRAEIVPVTGGLFPSSAETFDPSITILPEDLGLGTVWNYRGPVAGLDLKLSLKIVGEGDIEVPAGKFRALHFRGEKNEGLLTVADFWFVRGVGSIKETVTQRSPSGDLLSRNSIELLNLPAPQQTEPIAGKKKLEASVSTSSEGDSLNVISDDALQIVARWRGHGLRKNARVRAVWIAQDTGVAPVDFKVDEATAVAPTADAFGKFTLSRPPDGWATGKYRVEFYVDDKLTDTVELTISPSPPRSRSALDFLNPDRTLPASNF